MKASELRIGNWVEIDQYGNTRNIIRIDSGSDIDQVVKLRPSPIPLTPEILEKCGFEMMHLTSVKRWFNKDHIFYLQLEKRKYFLYGYKFYPNGITSLHQLQNLCYALTGEELIYNPNN